MNKNTFLAILVANIAVSMPIYPALSQSRTAEAEDALRAIMKYLTPSRVSYYIRVGKAAYPIFVDCKNNYVQSKNLPLTRPQSRTIIQRVCHK